jgi:DNA-binding response OmpR family regulator
LLALSAAGGRDLASTSSRSSCATSECIRARLLRSTEGTSAGSDAAKKGARGFAVVASRTLPFPVPLALRMRRLAGIPAINCPNKIIDFGAFVLDLERRCVRLGCEHIIKLSEAELLLARLFISAGDKVLTREMIAREALGRRFGEHSRAVDMLVSKLRRKLDPTGRASMIWAVRGEGYRFAGRRALQERLTEDLQSHG